MSNIPYHGNQYPGRGGHYESWFLRGNHPERDLAFWVRYTQFIAADKRPSLGEIWAIWFDGENGKVIACKQEFPLDDCVFSHKQMAVKLPQAELTSGRAHGHASHNGNELRWNLNYEGDSAPLLFLPEKLYDAPLPKAKSVSSRPQMFFNGEFNVNGETHRIDDWRGSENHNWGSKHTDQYAWGQVVGFDNAPETFFECATARVKLGPVYSPWLSLAVLRHEGEDLMFNQLGTALRAKGRYRFFDWQLSSKRGDARLTCHIQAEPQRFAGLTYYNPPAGSKTCLNSKIARCDLTLERKGQPPLKLTSANKAAFEIFTNSTEHGIPISV